MVLPCVALLIAVVAAAGAGGRAQLSCQDAAWTAARLAARGEPVATAVSAAAAVAPPRATVTVNHGGEVVTTGVRARVTLLPGSGRWQLAVSCSSTAWLESGTLT